MGRLDALSPIEFENLCFDLLQASGMHNLVWRTPGSDGGRDIEGEVSFVDFSGVRSYQNWYVECKRYNTSIDWATVWKKISFAENRNADYLLVISNNNPSPQCETEISQWNSNTRHTYVRFWRGYELDGIISKYPLIEAKYGFSASANLTTNVYPLIFELMKCAQTIYAGQQLGSNIAIPIEANAALAELILMRLDHITQYGKFVSSTKFATSSLHPWLTWSGPFGNWDEVGMRALLCFLRHITSSQSLHVKSGLNDVEIEFINNRLNVNETSSRIIRDICIWADLQLVAIDRGSVKLCA